MSHHHTKVIKGRVLYHGERAKKHNIITYSWSHVVDSLLFFESHWGKRISKEKGKSEMQDSYIVIGRRKKSDGGRYVGSGRGKTSSFILLVLVYRY